MESIVNDFILIHISDITYTANHLLSPHQFGFLPGRSCTAQLLDVLIDSIFSGEYTIYDVLNYLTVNLDAVHCIDAIYLDFQRAFDSVSHKRFLLKLTTLFWHP